MVNPNPSPFQSFSDPNKGLAPNLIPTPPAEMPAAPEVADAVEQLSPFVEAQDVDSIIAQLSLDRPLPLYIPNREKYKQYQFHIINDTPQELAHAMRRGWRPVDDPELVKLFEGKVSGSDKTGRITKPVLVARDRRIGEAEDKMKRQKLSELNKGLDPRNKQFNSKYAEQAASDTKGTFSGTGIGKIRV